MSEINAAVMDKVNGEIQIEMKQFSEPALEEGAVLLKTVFSEVCGSPRAVSEGMDMTRDNGTYVIAGQYTDSGAVSINPYWQINKKHLDVKGVWGIDYSHFYKTVRLMAKHNQRFGWHRLVSKIYPLDDVKVALNDVENLLVVKAVIAPNEDR